MFLYIKEIYVLFIKTSFFIVFEPLFSEHQYRSVQELRNLFQCCFVNVEATPMNIYWFNFHFQPNINVQTTLVHRHWIDVILSMLFQRCFVNVETTLGQLSISTKFQRRDNIGSSTLNQYISIDVASTFFFQPWNNVDNCAFAQISF